MSSLSLVTAPAIEPVTVQELKDHLRLDGSEEDPYLEALITAARMEAENYTGRQFIQATWDWYMDCFPAARTFEIPKAPLSSITSITYTDDQGNTDQTWASTNYKVDAPAGPHASPGRVSMANGVSYYPSTYSEINTVKIRFVAGYGTSVTDVPAPIRHAILLLAGEMFNRREQVIVGTSHSRVDITAERLLYPFRVMRWA